MKTTTVWIIIVALVGIHFVPAAVAGHEITKPYTTAGTPFVSPFGCLGEIAGQQVSISGACFSPTEQDGHNPVEVRISDVSGGNVFFSACQDADGDNICGLENDPFAEFCGTVGDLGESENPFDAGTDTVVMVRIWHPDCPDGLATSGEITLVTG